MAPGSDHQQARKGGKSKDVKNIKFQFKELRQLIRENIVAPGSGYPFKIGELTSINSLNTGTKQVN